jgi:hypothetical protein
MGEYQAVNELANLVELTEGLEREGIYTRTFEHELKKGDTVQVHEFKELDSDETFQFMGCGSLNYQMDKLSVDDRVKVVYKGKKEVENPKQAGVMTKCHDFDVFKWTE